MIENKHWNKCPTKYGTLYTNPHYAPVKEVDMENISKFVVSYGESYTFDSLDEAIFFSGYKVGRVD